jgi:hypothetical protein
MKAAFSRIIGALLLAVALAGCSTVKLGYNALDEVAWWWVDGYADFNDDQAIGVRESITRLHAWHRAHELPRIADLLGRLEQMAAGPVTASQACAMVPDFMARIHAAWDQVEPSAVNVAMQLTSQQLDHIQRKFGDNNRKFRREWVEIRAADLQERRLKLLQDRLEMIYGTLDGPQLAALRAGLERSAFDPQRNLNERLRRQQDLMQVLRRANAGQAQPPQVRTLLRGYVARVFQSPDPAYRAYQQAQLEEGCRIAAAVHETTTPAQRQEAVRRLRGYQRDLRELAASPS